MTFRVLLAVDRLLLLEFLLLFSLKIKKIGGLCLIWCSLSMLGIQFCVLNITVKYFINYKQSRSFLLRKIAVVSV